jgi:hypothetical protein
MTTQAKCWICSGKGNSLCGNCNRAVLDRIAKFNIDKDDAIWQLRQDVIAEEQDAAAEVEPQVKNFWGTERTI